MDFTISELKKHHKERYEMPQHFMNQLADENLLHLSFVTRMIYIFGSINIIYVLIKNWSNLTEKIPHLVYYGIPVVSCLFCAIWVDIILKYFKDASHRVKNMPLHFANISLLFAFTLNFWPDGAIFNHYNGFVLLACVEIVSAVFFNAYPNVYDLINFPFVLATFIMELDKIGLACSFNILIYFFVLHMLSVYRWHSTRTKLLHQEKMRRLNGNLTKEINIAADIQQKFFEYDLSDIHGWEIGYYNKAMTGVSGDLFDFYKRENLLDGFGIFDVSGHGISSGLLTLLVKNVIQQQFYKNASMTLEEMVEEINNQVILQKGGVENYLTGILARISGSTIEFVDAGHPLPLIYTKADDNIEYFIETPGERYGVIGLKDFPVKYQSETIDFRRGDEMILYSDGVMDVEDKNGEVYGPQRFLECVKKYTSLKAQDQVNFISEEVRSFQTGTNQKDDITIIIIKKI